MHEGEAGVDDEEGGGGTQATFDIILQIRRISSYPNTPHSQRYIKGVQRRTKRGRRGRGKGGGTQEAVLLRQEKKLTELYLWSRRRFRISRLILERDALGPAGESELNVAT